MSAWDDISDSSPRRRFARRPVELQARLRIGSSEVAAITENVSPGGAFLRAAVPESVDEVVASIGLPHGRDLHVRARVRWRRQGGSPGVGVEFVTFLQADRDLPVVG